MKRVAPPSTSMFRYQNRKNTPERLELKKYNPNLSECELYSVALLRQRIAMCFKLVPATDMRRALHSPPRD